MDEIVKYINALSDNEKIQQLLIKTIGSILLKQDNIELFKKENEGKIIHIRDWIFSVVESNEQWKTPRVLTIDALNNAANKYFEKKNNKLQTIKLDETHEKLIADLGDYYVIQMLTPEALDNESKVMQHCIGYGSYDTKLQEKNWCFLSLRDKFNKAHVTTEIFRKNIIQLQGKQNKLPEMKYLESLVSWLAINKYELNLIEYGFIFNKNDNKIYHFYEIPDNCEIDGDVNFSNLDIEKLPDNLVINGSLNLCDCRKLKYLPKNLKIKKDLYIKKTKVNKIPLDLIVEKNVYLYDSVIKDFSKKIKISGDLKLHNVFIEKGLSGFSGNNISYTNSKVRLLDNLIVNGDLNLDFNEKLKKLPNNLIVKGSLSLKYSGIVEFYNNTIVDHDIVLSYSTIEKLPDNFVVNGNLDLSSCKKLLNLPKNLTVHGKIDIKNNNQILNIPKDLICDEIIISNNQILLITEYLNFKRINVNGKTYEKEIFFSEKIKKQILNSFMFL